MCIKDDLNDSFLKENKLIFKKYKPIKKIDNGSFGNIYSVIRLEDKNVFAMKTEKKFQKYEYLDSEAYYLFTLQGGFGIPKLISYGQTKNYKILIETLLDKSLYTIFIFKEKKCSIVDACLIGIQILERLEWIHSKNIVYKDVKPENFLIGIDDPNVIYAVDFGLCKKYRSSKTGKHLLPKYTRKFSGTVAYASINALIGKETSRRDDLISLGYMLIVLLKRNIPLNISFKNYNKQKFLELLNLKKTGEKLYRGIPEEIEEFIKYSKNLKFEQDPDYSYLRSLFTKILMSNTLNYKKLTFSWIKSKDKELLGIPRNISFRKSSPQYRILQNIKERKKNKLSSQGLKLDNISNEKNDKNNIYEKLLKTNKFNMEKIEKSINKERTEKNKNIKNYFNNLELKEINSKKEKEQIHIKYIPLQPKKANDNNISSLNKISNLNPIPINNNNNYILRNIKTPNGKTFKNNNQKSYININFYTNNTIFQRDGQESRFKFNNSNNSNSNRYTRINSNNMNKHQQNSVSNENKINYIKTIKNKNNKIQKYICIRNNIEPNNSKIFFDKNDKNLSSPNVIQQKKVNFYKPLDNTNSFINYDIKNEDKLFSDKIIKKIKQTDIRNINSSIPSRNENKLKPKILNISNSKTLQPFNNFNYSNNISYKSRFINDYNQNISLKKYMENSSQKIIYKDMTKSDIDLFRNKINKNVNSNNKNQNLKSLPNENYLKFNYSLKDNYLPLRNYSSIKVYKSNIINRLNNKSMNNNYNYN